MKMTLNNSIGLSFDRILMDGISDKIFVVSVENGAFVYEFLNRAAMDELGVTKSILGKSIREIFPNERENFLHSHYNKVVTSGETVIYQDSYIDPSGKRHYSETKLIPLFNDEQECKQIVATVKNISKEKQAATESARAWAKLNESNKRYQSLFHHNPDAIFSFDLNGRITHGNIAVEKVTGYKPMDLMGSTLYSLAIREDINSVKALFIQAVGGTTGNCQLAILNKMGNQIEVSLKVTPLIIDDEVIGIYGILRDVTDITNSLKRLEESEERFRIIAENAHDLVSLINDKGEIIYASPSYEDILGYDNKEYEGKLFLYNVHPDDSNHLNKKIIESIKDGQPFTAQFKQFNHENEAVWSQTHGAPVFDDRDNFKHLVMLTRDISLQKKYESKLKHFALHDSLTNLPNRRLFKERLTQALEDYRDKEDGLAVIMMDIDHFKNINDEFGHDIGDGVIEEFAKRVSETIRDCDMVARLGGDEFVILLPSIGSTDNVTAIAEDIQKAVLQSWNINGNSLRVTTSMGIAIAPLKDVTPYSMLKNADVALYEAKNSGRNSFKLRVFKV